MAARSNLLACVLVICALFACSGVGDVGTADAAQRKPPAISDPQSNQVPRRLPERPPMSKSEQQAAVIPGLPQARFWADSEADFLRALPSAAGAWLMLSSGGSDGAYGAGILSGWTDVRTRPQFSVVTGVSTGAMIAPFAFVGGRYGDKLRGLYSSLTAADIFEVGGTGESMLNTWPLKDLLAKQVTPQLLADVAAEHRRGRRLFVVTTNLDAERPVVWNMGEIAARGDNAALALFRDVLLASASIPGMFPPVYIDVEANGRHFREMHADGGMGGAFYVAPPSLLSDLHPNRLPAKELYIIINGKLAPEFEVTERNPLAILGRSIATTLKTATRMQLERVYRFATRNGVAFNLAYVDENFDKASRGSFDPEYMRALLAFGAAQARGGSAFHRQPPAEQSPDRAEAACDSRAKACESIH